MARRTDTLIIVTGELIAETPIHVGGAGGAIESDLALAVDGRGKFYVPGTSLAGAIRAYLDRADGKPNEDCDDAEVGQGASRQVWGHGERKREIEALDDRASMETRALPDEERAAHKKKAQGVASRLIVRDACVLGDAVAEIRDHVGIDRHSGTAHPGIKYDRQILPKGTCLGFHMEVELAEHDATAPHEANLKAYRRDFRDDTRRVADAVQALASGRIRFGGAKTRGLGRLRLVDAEVKTIEVGKRDGVLGLVRLRAGLGEGESQTAKKFVADAGSGKAIPPVLRIRIDWEPDGPVMVKSSADGLGVDALPLVSGIDDDKLSMVIPGAAIKGRLRSHAERIALTLGLERPQDGTGGAPDGGTKGGGRDAFLRQLARSPLLETLFGIPGPKQADDREDSARHELGLGAVFVDDCFATNRAADRKGWHELMAAAKDEFGGMDNVLGALRALPGWQADEPATHVAIDRWTGGAAPSLLYSALEPRGVDWEKIEIEVALDRLKPNADDPGAEAAADGAIALLFLTLRDFAAGRVPLGFGGNRGYGAVKVKKITFDIEGDAGWSGGVRALKRVTIDGGGQAGPDADLDGLNASWKGYLKKWDERGGSARQPAAEERP